MRKMKILVIIGIICIIASIIITILQVMYPHPYRGIFGRIFSILSLILFYLYGKINHINFFKSPFYDPDKKKHLRNWIIFITSSILVIVMIVFLFSLKS